MYSTTYTLGTDGFLVMTLFCNDSEVGNIERYIDNSSKEEIAGELEIAKTVLMNTYVGAPVTRKMSPAAQKEWDLFSSKAVEMAIAACK